MAPFNLAPLLHPSHVTLSPTHHPSSSRHSTIRSLISYLDDPYYTTARTTLEHQHKHVATPNFDIHETEHAYFLEGEFSGVSGKTAIVLEKLGSRGLLIEAKVEKLDLVQEWGIPAGIVVVSSHAKDGSVEALMKESEKQEKASTQDSGSKEAASSIQASAEAAVEPQNSKGQGQAGVPSCLLSERHLGYLQRSFTFPQQLDFKGLKARLRNGLLLVMVPKAEKADKEEGDEFVIED
jgi:HSP20 family molecular chaperone IbpA